MLYHTVIRNVSFTICPKQGTMRPGSPGWGDARGRGVASPLPLRAPPFPRACGVLSG